MDLVSFRKNDVGRVSTFYRRNCWLLNEPTGQSGLFRSKHYDDQTDIYNNGEFKPFMFNYDALDEAKSSKMIFKSK